jgi:hypothetical protein
VITSVGRFFPERVNAAAVMMADHPLSILGAFFGAVYLTPRLLRVSLLLLSFSLPSILLA